MASRGINRRQFLRLSAAVAAAGAVTACGGGSTAPTPTKPATSGSTTASTPAAAASPTAAGAAPTLAVSNATSTPAAQAAAPTKFKESPALADMVKAGKLPPIEQRLPSNPRILKPRGDVGVYGGVWHRAYQGLSDRVGPTKLNEQMPMMWDAPDPNTIRLIANWVEKWDQNADATEYTFYMRKGIKWSDGTEVTTDDTSFWWNDMALNKDIAPAQTYSIRQRVGSDYKVGTLTVVDKYTFKVNYVQPYPLLPTLLAKSNGIGVGQTAFLAPSKYLKQFHPKYATPDALAKAAADKKVSTWQDLWGNAGAVAEGPIAFWFLNPDLPVIQPWKIVNPTPADPVVMERNPYFWYVDTDGNQLPYIDRVEHAFINNPDVLNLRIAGGQIDMQYRNVSLGSYTFLKENEAKGNYKVQKWRSASTDSFFPNINTPDKVLGKLFDTADFRHALSIAIDRKSINELVWNGLGKPRQASPIPGSPEYDPDLEKVWTEYDVKTANDLLDKLGLTKNADGTRKRPDGQTLGVTIEHQNLPGSPDEDAVIRVQTYWNAIGVKTNVKSVQRALYQEHVNNGDIQIGQWGFDRCSVVKADPGRWIATIPDGPWAPTYGNFYLQNTLKKDEPPQDHPIRKMWALWDQTQVEPDEVKRNALFQQLLGIHKQAPYAIGVVGEKVQPVIVSNSFHNMPDGYIADDTLRDYGLVNPSQFFIKK
jgi:peptide/nickel transport system substrate-binding protein